MLCISIANQPLTHEPYENQPQSTRFQQILPASAVAAHAQRHHARRPRLACVGQNRSVWANEWTKQCMSRCTSDALGSAAVIPSAVF